MLAVNAVLFLNQTRTVKPVPVVLPPNAARFNPRGRCQYWVDDPDNCMAIGLALLSRFYVVVNVNAAAAKDGAPSPEFTVLLTDKGAKIKRFPAVRESNRPIPTITPHAAVGAANVIVLLLLVVPVVPVDAAVEPAD